MKIEIVIGAAGAVVGTLVFAFGVFQYLERRKQQLLIDLQGGKEAVAAAAKRIRDGELPHRIPRISRKRRRSLLEALCLAAVFEGSGRSRALIYAALGRTVELDRYTSEINEIVGDLSAVIVRNSPYTDLSRATRRIYALRAALNLDGDVRVRVTYEQALRAQPKSCPTPDKRLTHSAHTWNSLTDTLPKERAIVLINAGPNSGARTIIALDFHRIARARKQGGERFLLTPTGNCVVQGKYGKGAADKDVDTQKISTLAKRLANVIRTSPQYKEALWISAVPGTKHDFSVLLGKAVADEAGKRFVKMSVSRESDIGDTYPEFIVTEPTNIEGSIGIIVDDVYRTGKALNAAAEALLEKRAIEILGLTATCTVSSATLDCMADCLTDLPTKSP